VDADDRHHQACADLLETHPGPLIVPTLVITEVVYLLGTRLGTQAELRFLADMASGAFDVEPVHPTDWLRIADLVERYRDLPLGAVDASVIACAERLGVDQVATVDRRHFTVIKANRQLALLP
jgi:predicted nucleic acid-binding protein